MTRKEKLEREIKTLEENCERARRGLRMKFKEDSFELLQEILDNQEMYFVYKVEINSIFEKDELCQFNKICLCVIFQDNGIMYISLPISEKEQEE